MDLNRGEGSEARFTAYVAGLGSAIGQAVRMRPLRDFFTGLMLPGERKSVEPMAQDGAGADGSPAPITSAFSRWRDLVGALLAKVRQMVLPAIEGSGPIKASIIDDT